MIATITPPAFPRDRQGRAISRQCPVCDGKLQFEGDGYWRCDGLVDPARDHLPLEACTYTHEDGTATKR